MASDTEFENETIVLLQRNLYMKKDDFVQALEKENKDKVGFSRPTIYKKLGVMIAEGTIAEIPFDTLPKYGIVETNRRSVYIILKRSTQIKEYLDSIFGLLLKGDDVDRDVILKDIESYKKQYSLDAKQLDVLIDLLDSSDTKVTDTLLRIIYDWIVKFKRSPSNQEKLIKSLKKALAKYQEPIQAHGNLRTHIIFLLGWFKQDIVFEQFVKDVRTLQTPANVGNDYWHEFTAEILEKNRRALFDLEREMFKIAKKAREEGDLNTANIYENKGSFVRQTKFQAMILLNLAEDEFKKQLEEHTELIDSIEAPQALKLYRAMKETLK